jgi:predicted RNA-binding protein associated with RNAse of E/G family
MQARIHYVRIGKPATLYTEGFVDDDGYRLITFSITPHEISPRWSKRWQDAGLIPAGRMIGSVEKHHFYGEYFTILKICDEAGRLLGYYCDIATPLQKVGGDYVLHDLILDLWIYPDLTVRELDWDEFEEARKSGLLSSDLQEKAIATLHRLKAETARGIFPAAYLS